MVRPISGGKARSALARSVRWMRRRIAKRRYQRLHEDRLRDYEWALLNIKTLGYELARLLTNCQPRPVPTEAPTAALRAKLCTQSDMESAWVSFWCAEVGVGPVYHRKIWELCYIAQVLHSAGMLTAGRSGIGFGCGREPLPSLFAKYGCEVLATDLPRNTAAARGWAGQLATGLIDVRRPEICSDQQKLDNIRFRYLDMNKIPEDLYGAFDFCWSSCALEHLGSLAQGAEFIEASLRVLKPQGMACTRPNSTCPSREKRWMAGIPCCFSEDTSPSSPTDYPLRAILWPSWISRLATGYWIGSSTCLSGIRTPGAGRCRLLISK